MSHQGSICNLGSMDDLVCLGTSFAFDYYSSYVFHPMYLETLQAMVDAKVNSRLDYQKATMDDLVDAIRVDKSDSILERLLHNLSRQQSILQPVKMVSASDTVTTNQYVIHQKRKNFFGRLKDVFSSALVLLSSILVCSSFCHIT